MNLKKKTCPYCGEEIEEGAQKCRYCSSWLVTRDGNPIVAAHSIRPHAPKNVKKVEQKKPLKVKEDTDHNGEKRKAAEKYESQGISTVNSMVAHEGQRLTTRELVEENSSIRQFFSDAPFNKYVIDAIILIAILGYSGSALHSFYDADDYLGIDNRIGILGDILDCFPEWVASLMTCVGECMLFFNLMMGLKSVSSFLNKCLMVLMFLSICSTLKDLFWGASDELWIFDIILFLGNIIGFITVGIILKNIQGFASVGWSFIATPVVLVIGVLALPMIGKDADFSFVVYLLVFLSSSIPFLAIREKYRYNCYS